MAAMTTCRGRAAGAGRGAGGVRGVVGSTCEKRHSLPFLQVPEPKKKLHLVRLLPGGTWCAGGVATGRMAASVRSSRALYRATVGCPGRPAPATVGCPGRPAPATVGCPGRPAPATVLLEGCCSGAARVDGGRPAVGSSGGDGRTPGWGVDCRWKRATAAHMSPSQASTAAGRPCSRKVRASLLRLATLTCAPEIAAASSRLSAVKQICDKGTSTSHSTVSSDCDCVSSSLLGSTIAADATGSNGVNCATGAHDCATGARGIWAGAGDAAAGVSPRGDAAAAMPACEASSFHSFTSPAARLCTADSGGAALRSRLTILPTPLAWSTSTLIGITCSSRRSANTMGSYGLFAAVPSASHSQIRVAPPTPRKCLSRAGCRRWHAKRAATTIAATSAGGLGAASSREVRASRSATRWVSAAAACASIKLNGADIAASSALAQPSTESGGEARPWISVSSSPTCKASTPPSPSSLPFPSLQPRTWCGRSSSSAFATCTSLSSSPLPPTQPSTSSSSSTPSSSSSTATSSSSSLSTPPSSSLSTPPSSSLSTPPSCTPSPPWPATRRALPTAAASSALVSLPTAATPAASATSAHSSTSTGINGSAGPEAGASAACSQGRS